MKIRTAALNRRTAGAIDLASLIVIVVVVVAIAVTGFFIYRGGALKTELVRARGDAERERIELQAQVKTASFKVREAADQTSQLQAQVDLAKAETATTKANASTQVNQLQLQLDQSKRQAVDAQSKLQKLSTELAGLRAQLQEPSPSPALAPAPVKVQPAPAAVVNPEPVNLARLPVNVSFKKAPLGDSNALALQNTSSSSLSLAVKFSNPTDSKEVQVKLDPGASREIGWLGAWVLASGDKVEIKSAGFAAVVRTAP